jgi:DNA repair protein RecO (recombination protein O)
VLSAIRHIVLADFDRLFNFRISDSVQLRLSAVSEAYLISHLERRFPTLDFYKTLT